MRASYWHRNLPNALNCKVTTITAQEDAAGDNVIVVPKFGTSFLSNFIKDDGVVWKNNLKEYLGNTTAINPDMVIISGGPFMQFGLTKWLKAKFNTKVILDYRDPFANNPGFDNSGFKSAIKKYFEKKFNKHADGMVTVNTHCADLIENYSNKANAIVQNGYDETVQPILRPISLEHPSFSYTGKFYFNPDPFLEAICEEDLKLNLAGPDVVSNESPLIHHHGFLEYKDAVQLVADNDIGIIQTYGEDFQSTTKIFDYVRCERAILVVSNKHIGRGSINEELKDYPNVFWAKNDKKSIIEAIRKIRSTNYEKPTQGFHLKYSRANQMQKLAALIMDLAK